MSVKLQTLKGFRDFLPKKSRSGKTFLYTDGTNLLAGLAEIFGIKKVPKFQDILKEIYKLYKIDQIYFYASYTSSKYIKSKKIREYIKLERDFFNQVKNTNNLTFYKGYRSPSSKKEKGVDVHLAVDIVKDAFLKRFSQAVIFSGDADLAYSVEIVRNLGMRIYALFLPNRFSLAVAYQAISPAILDYKKVFKTYKLKKRIRKLKIVEIKDPA